MSSRRLLFAVLFAPLAFSGTAALADQPAPAIAVSSSSASSASAENPLGLPDSDLFNPGAQTKLPPCFNCVRGHTSSPGGGAASHWGFGANCTAATNDLSAQLSNYASSVCASEGDDGLCSFTVIHTTSCFWSSGYGAYQIDGYTNFGCMFSWC